MTVGQTTDIAFPCSEARHPGSASQCAEALVLRPACEVCRTDYGALMITLTDNFMLVMTSNHKAKLPADNRQQASLGGNSNANWRCRDVAHIDKSPDGMLAFQHVRAQTFHTGPFDQANHESRGEHRRHGETDKRARQGGPDDALVDHD